MTFMAGVVACGAVVIASVFEDSAIKLAAMLGGSIYLIISAFI